MRRLQTFRVAGLTLAVSSEHELGVHEKWRKFASDQTPAQLRYEICYADQLPPCDGELLYEDRQLRIVRQAQGKRYVYRNFCTGTQSASALEIPGQGEILKHITVSRERYPWATAVEHLFEVYDLPHYLPMFGRMMLHCSYVLHEGKALLFTAPSGTGKSTQAELWRKRFGALIVNGDRAAMGMEENVAMAYGLPFSGSSDDCENVDAPVAAIISLSQAKENRIERISGVRALKELMRGAYVTAQHQADLPVQLAVAQTILEHVPMYHLACLPEVSAAELVRATVFGK